MLLKLTALQQKRTEHRSKFPRDRRAGPDNNGQINMKGKVREKSQLLRKRTIKKEREDFVASLPFSCLQTCSQ